GGSSGNAGRAATGNPGNRPGATAWEVTYDLTGSEFENSETTLGAGDQVNTLQMPYSDDTNWGPGTMVLRFSDTGGAPSDGSAQVVSYVATMDFVVRKAATVHTQLNVDAVGSAGECGAALGALTGDTLSFTTPLHNYHTKGVITCEAGLCGLAGLEQPRNEDETKDLPLNSFVFTNGISAFEMAKTTVSKDSQARTTLAFKGTETSRTQVCACE
ncbi:MAG: hypothetical protein AB7K71_05810, partial [Polyangiaceae bacterium]